MKDGMDDRMRFIDALHDEMSKEDPDIRSLAESVKDKIKRISGLMEENLDLFINFYETLNDAQKEKIIIAFREKTEMHRL